MHANDEDNPLLDAVSDVAGEILSFKKEKREWAAWKTLSAYGHVLTATVVAFMPGTPTISQHVARKPDEHLSSDAQPSTVNNEGASEYVVSATTSTSESVEKVQWKVKRFPPE